MADYETEKLLVHVRELWRDRNCPMCGKGPWNIENKVFQLTEFTPGVVALGGPVVPVIPVTCMNCGYSALINAIVSKAIPKQKDLKEASE